MNLAGALTLSYQGPSVPLQIDLQRPQNLARLLHHKPVRSAQQMIFLLFSVCRRAQAVAAARALENALAIAVPTHIEQQRNALLLLESLQEHLWLLLVRLPHSLALELSAAKGEMAASSQRLQLAMGQWDDQQRLTQIWSEAKAVPAAAGQDAEEPLAEWAQQLLAGAFWTELLARQAHALAALDWCSDYRLEARPSHGYSETGPLMRQRQQADIAAELMLGKCLLPRFHAVVKEAELLLNWLARGVSQGVSQGLAKTAPPSLQGDAEQVAPGEASSGVSCARVETARGRLQHRVALTPDTEQINHYEIVAPTDVNFHPAGVLPSMLAQVPPGLMPSKQQLTLLVQLMNPCIAWEVQYHA
jgi:hypothetical protein